MLQGTSTADYLCHVTSKYEIFENPTNIFTISQFYTRFLLGFKNIISEYCKENYNNFKT